MAGNYADTKPTIEVEKITDTTRHCRNCGETVVYGPTYPVPEGKKWDGLFGTHRHASEAVGDVVKADPPAEWHYAGPRAVCQFCGSDEHTKLVQYPWYDSHECSRCGGASNWGIGD